MSAERWVLTGVLAVVTVLVMVLTSWVEAGSPGDPQDRPVVVAGGNG